MVENGLNGVVGHHVLKLATGELRKEQDLVEGKKELPTHAKGRQSNKQPAPNSPSVVRNCK